MAGTLKVDSIENLAGNGYVTTSGNTSIDASGATTSIKLPRGTLHKDHQMLLQGQ